MSVPPEVDAASKALSELDNSHRDVIVAKLANLVSAVDAAEKRTRAAESKMAEQTVVLEKTTTEMAQQKMMSDVDVSLLGAQITQLCNAMSQETKDNFSVTAAGTIDAFNSGDPAKMATASLRTIMCANATMMARMATTPETAPEETRPAKRARAETTAVAPPAAETQEQLLARALYDTFEI